MLLRLKLGHSKMIFLCILTSCYIISQNNDESIKHDFFTAVVNCKADVVENMLKKDPELINATYESEKLFPLLITHTESQGLEFEEEEFTDDPHNAVMYVIDELKDNEEVMEELSQA
jgi:hypothetical protein